MASPDRSQTALTQAKLWISSLNFPVRITHPMRSKPGAHGSSSRLFSTWDGRSLHTFKCCAADESWWKNDSATLWKTHQPASACVGVYYSSLLSILVVLWPRYTLNTSSNGIYVVENSHMGYITTLLRDGRTGPALARSAGPVLASAGPIILVQLINIHNNAHA